MSNKTLYIIRGVPGSGKSTLAHQLTKNVVETDDFMMVDGEYKYDKDKVYACHKKCFNKVLDYMAHSVTPIAVANTFIKKKDYKPYVDLAKEFGYNVEIKVCKGDYKNVHNVPQDRVEQMKSKFQESINSLLEMNGDVGITEAIENKKQSNINDNFWKWFGNSKVVDENGNPLVVYHGTRSQFNEFDRKYAKRGFFFTTEKRKNSVAGYYAYWNDAEGSIMPCYIKLENPLIVHRPNGNEDDIARKNGTLSNYDGIIVIYDDKDDWEFSDYDYIEKKRKPLTIKNGEVIEYIVFDPNNIKSVKNNGNWSLNNNNIYEEKEVIEERLFPELSDRKYNELLWFTTPNMTANAYTKFFGKEMIADRIPSKYLITLSSNDISLKDLVEKHRKLYNAKQVKPIADYKDFNDFITDLNKSKYLSRNDKSNIAKSGAKIIKSFGDWDLYDITTWEAAKKYGSGTTWCVTDSTSDDYFKRYTNRLPFNNYQTEEDMKKSIRSLLFLINPNTDRKMAISVFKRIDYDWYNDEIEFYNEEDEFFYTCRHTSNGSISSKDDIVEKISYFGNDWPDADVVEDYGVTEDFINSVTQFIKDMYRMNKEQIVEDINKLRQKYKKLMNIKESANYSTNMTWEEFVEKVGRENEFDGSVVILKHNTSIVIRQSGTILVRIGKNPFKKAYSNLKTFDEIYNMLVEKGFIEEQILTEAVNQHSLYHGCDLAYAVSMMIDNAMRGETIANINGKKYQGNSLTRSLQFAKDWQEERWDGHGDELNQFWVVLELNKERLKTKYKVLPYNYWEEYFGQDYEHTIDRNGYGDQYEEFVVGRINNLRNYLDDVYLSDECLYGEYAEILAIVKRELELRGENYTDSQIVKALQQLGIDKPSPNDFDGDLNTLNEAHSYYINNVKLYENPSIQWMKKKLNSGTELRILIDGDLEEPYFGEWIVWDANDTNHKKVLDSLNLYEEDYISVRLCKDSIRYWGYTKEKIDKLQECEIIQKLYPNGYELISEW